MPAKRNSALDAITAPPAWARSTSPSRAKMSAIAAVAKTSKKPSTQRWTTHQRQYSITVRCVRALKKKPAPYIRPIAALATVNIHTRVRAIASASSLRAPGRRGTRCSAGRMPRSIRTSQITSPAKSAICQTRPRSTYS